MQPCLRIATLQRCRQLREDCAVETAYGTMTGRAGDWLMEGTTGKLYVLSDEDFRRSYKLTGGLDAAAA